jgi:translation initiation factor IF-3
MENGLSKHRKSVRSVVNNQIRSDTVRCINQDNENLGIISKHEAMSLANSKGLDLVQVSPLKKGTIPTCKIIDYGKYKYDLSRKEKVKSKKQRESIIKLKEIKFRPCTGVHDLSIKATRAAKFLKDDCKLKITVVFKGREKTHTEVALNKLDDFIDLVMSSDILVNTEVVILNRPSIDSKSINLYMVKDNKQRISKAS